MKKETKNKKSLKKTYENPKWVKNAANIFKNDKGRIKESIKEMEAPDIMGKSIVWWFKELKEIFDDKMVKKSLGPYVYENVQTYMEMKAVLSYMEDDEEDDDEEMAVA